MRFVLGLFFIFISLTSLASQNDFQITKPIILMGDSQEHERHGTFTFVAGTLVDKHTKVAARSPQLDLYAKYSMLDVINRHVKSNNINNLTDGQFAIHLGDFLDISCRSEWRRFMELAKDPISTQKLILGVGNHDGFYVGNYAFDNMESHAFVGAQSWRDRCTAGKDTNYIDSDKNILHKGLLVKELVNFSKMLPNAKSNSDTCDPQNSRMLCGNVVVSNDWTIYYQYPADIDNKNVIKEDLSTAGKYWQSYFVSVITLPSAENVHTKVKLILLDTSQAMDPSQSIWASILSKFSNKPEIIKGHVQKDQRVLINNVLSERCPSVDNCLVIFAGHHPLKDFSSDSKKWLKDLIDIRKVNPKKNLGDILNLYISAHTHDGYVVDKGMDIKELNVGALIENNPHYRTFWISQDTVSKRYTVNSLFNSLIDEADKYCSQFQFEYKYIKDFPEQHKVSNAYEASLAQHVEKFFEGIYLNKYVKKFFEGTYLDKYAYLEQSRISVIQALEQLQLAAKKGNLDAIKVINSKLDDMPKKEMSRWAKDDSGFKVCQKEGSPQAKYWNADTYSSIDKIKSQLELMSSVTQLTKENIASKPMQCGGGNYSDSGFYLAYPESYFLSFLQDWLESIDAKSFDIVGQEHKMNYRSCMARFAAKSDPYVTRESATNNNPIDVSK